MQAVYREPQALPSFSRISSHMLNVPDSSAFREVVHLVEGDRHFREEIISLLVHFGIKVIAFASAAECLDFHGRDTAACIILNTRLPDICGLELQRLLSRQASAPVIFISDPCDIASAVRAMKAGALEFFTRPFDRSALVAAIRTAFAQDRRLRQRRAEIATLQERFALLTRREREVLPLIVGGLLNKQAAYLLGISEVTLQIHRSQVMRKMKADSFAELVRMALKLRIPYWRESRSGAEPRVPLSIAAIRDRPPTRDSTSTLQLGLEPKLVSRSNPGKLRLPPVA